MDEKEWKFFLKELEGFCRISQMTLIRVIPKMRIGGITYEKYCGC